MKDQRAKTKSWVLVPVITDLQRNKSFSAGLNYWLSVLHPMFSCALIAAFQM